MSNENKFPSQSLVLEKPLWVCLSLTFCVITGGYKRVAEAERLDTGILRVGPYGLLRKSFSVQF